MSENTGPLSGLGLIRAQAAWFEGRDDVLARVYSVAEGARHSLAIHAVVLNLALVAPRATQPLLLVLVSIVLMGWQVFISLLMRSPQRRTATAVGADIAVTVAIVLSTIWIVPTGAAPLSLAGYWLGGCAGYAVIFFGTWRGVAVAVVPCLALMMLPGFTPERVGISFVTILITFCLGTLITQFRNTIIEQEQERMQAAALAERQRLSRIVHDGALQVLALVEREGQALGPRGVRLAALAHESETQLRALLQSKEDFVVEQGPQVDLVSRLDKYESSSVTVSTMASEVKVSKLLVHEVEATLAEILKNVDLHAGPGAKAWLLLDQENDDEVIIWVRDNGVGMTADQVAEAAEAGRLGIKESIVGRMASLGGNAILKSSPGAGTEWELRFPTEVEAVE